MTQKTKKEVLEYMRFDLPLSGLSPETCRSGPLLALEYGSLAEEPSLDPDGCAASGDVSPSFDGISDERPLVTPDADGSEASPLLLGIDEEERTGVRAAELDCDR